jgi:ribonuclease G
MQQDILVNWSPQETRVALVEQGVVQELHIERTVERGRVGNIYLGRVIRVLPGMQSAFVDIGLERSAFLHVADLWRERGEGEAEVAPVPIEKRVFEGQTLMVQVVKDPIGSKGARLSTQISIAGRVLVYLPQDRRVGVSQRIPSEAREALRTRVQALVVEVATEAPAGGFIVRTHAEGATDDELRRDIAYLHSVWARVRDAGGREAAGSLLYQDLSLAQRVLRDLVGDETTSIRVDSREQLRALTTFAEQFTPAVTERLAHYDGERPIFELFNIDEEIAHALGRRVELKSGGYLIVDQTEALTTIDVNTGGFVGARSFDDTIFKTNLEAAQAIARQLRLRNLGGIIVVDFIDMAQAEHQQAVLLELRKRVARDRVKTHVGEFSPLGLVEMTRKRTRESLAQRLCQPCAQCGGSGRVRTVRTVVYDILREILREARQFEPKEFRVVAAPAVVEMLLGEESQHLAGLSDFIGKPIALRADGTIGPDQYDIVLL